MNPAAKRLRDRTISNVLEDRTAAGLLPIVTRLPPETWNRIESMLRSEGLDRKCSKPHNSTRE